MSFIEITAVLGNLGEFIGAIAVVATLFYVGLQVKHSKEATEANTRALEEGRKIALVDAYHARAVESSATMRIMADSQLAAISVKHHQSALESLTTEEKYRLRFLTMGSVYALDASFFAYQQGLLPEFESTLEVNLKALAPAWRDILGSTTQESA
jgi:hypothetical protein